MEALHDDLVRLESSLIAASRFATTQGGGGAAGSAQLASTAGGGAAGCWVEGHGAPPAPADSAAGAGGSCGYPSAAAPDDVTASLFLSDADAAEDALALPCAAVYARLRQQVACLLIADLRLWRRAGSSAVQLQAVRCMERSLAIPRGGAWHGHDGAGGGRGSGAGSAAGGVCYSPPPPQVSSLTVQHVLLTLRTVYSYHSSAGVCSYHNTSGGASAWTPARGGVCGGAARLGSTSASHPDPTPNSPPTATFTPMAADSHLSSAPHDQSHATAPPAHASDGFPPPDAPAIAVRKALLRLCAGLSPTALEVELALSYLEESTVPAERAELLDLVSGWMAPQILNWDSGWLATHGGGGRTAATAESDPQAPVHTPHPITAAPVTPPAWLCAVRGNDETADANETRGPDESRGGTQSGVAARLHAPPAGCAASPRYLHPSAAEARSSLCLDRVWAWGGYGVSLRHMRSPQEPVRAAALRLAAALAAASSAAGEGAAGTAQWRVQLDESVGLMRSVIGGFPLSPSVIDGLFVLACTGGGAASGDGHGWIAEEGSDSSVGAKAGLRTSEGRLGGGGVDVHFGPSDSAPILAHPGVLRMAMSLLRRALASRAADASSQASAAQALFWCHRCLACPHAGPANASALMSADIGAEAVLSLALGQAQAPQTGIAPQFGSRDAQPAHPFTPPSGEPLFTPAGPPLTPASPPFTPASAAPPIGQATDGGHAPDMPGTSPGVAPAADDTASAAAAVYAKYGAFGTTESALQRAASGHDVADRPVPPCIAVRASLLTVGAFGEWSVCLILRPTDPSDPPPPAGAPPNAPHSPLEAGCVPPPRRYTSPPAPAHLDTALRVCGWMRAHLLLLPAAPPWARDEAALPSVCSRVDAAVPQAERLTWRAVAGLHAAAAVGAILLSARVAPATGEHRLHSPDQTPNPLPPSQTARSSATIPHAARCAPPAAAVAGSAAAAPACASAAELPLPSDLMARLAALLVEIDVVAVGSARAWRAGEGRGEAWREGDELEEALPIGWQSERARERLAPWHAAGCSQPSLALLGSLVRLLDALWLADALCSEGAMGACDGLAGRPRVDSPRRHNPVASPLQELCGEAPIFMLSVQWLLLFLQAEWDRQGPCSEACGWGYADGVTGAGDSRGDGGDCDGAGVSGRRHGGGGTSTGYSGVSFCHSGSSPGYNSGSCPIRPVESSARALLLWLLSPIGFRHATAHMLLAVVSALAPVGAQPSRAQGLLHWMLTEPGPTGHFWLELLPVGTSDAENSHVENDHGRGSTGDRSHTRCGAVAGSGSATEAGRGAATAAASSPPALSKLLASEAAAGACAAVAATQASALLDAQRAAKPGVRSMWSAVACAAELNVASVRSWPAHPHAAGPGASPVPSSGGVPAVLAVHAAKALPSGHGRSTGQDKDLIVAFPRGGEQGEEKGPAGGETETALESCLARPATPGRSAGQRAWGVGQQMRPHTGGEPPLPWLARVQLEASAGAARHWRKALSWLAHDEALGMAPLLHTLIGAAGPELGGMRAGAALSATPVQWKLDTWEGPRLYFGSGAADVTAGGGEHAPAGARRLRLKLKRNWFPDAHAAASYSGKTGGEAGGEADGPARGERGEPAAGVGCGAAAGDAGERACSEEQERALGGGKQSSGEGCQDGGLSGGAPRAHVGVGEENRTPISGKGLLVPPPGPLQSTEGGAHAAPVHAVVASCGIAVPVAPARVGEAAEEEDLEEDTEGGGGRDDAEGGGGAVVAGEGGRAAGNLHAGAAEQSVPATLPLGRGGSAGDAALRGTAAGGSPRGISDAPSVAGRPFADEAGGPGQHGAPPAPRAAAHDPPVPDSSAAGAAPPAPSAVLCLPCQLVRPTSVQPGQLQIFRDCIRFVPGARRPGSTAADVHAAAPAAGWAREGEPSLYEAARVRTWRLSGLREILHRRYLLRRVALELFLTCGKAHLLTFESRSHRRRAHATLVSLRTPALLPSSTSVGWPGRDWLETQHAQLVDDWQRWRISNLDYLLRLNTLAGRTYNDLTQYPVLPWVLKDYSSTELDPADPEVYRDLAKPVGALDPKRAAGFKERFDSLRDEFDPAEAAAGCGGPGSIPPFHYGSHYSSAGIVLYFLLRLEPFTTEAIRLQGGRWRRTPRAPTPTIAVPPSIRPARVISLPIEVGGCPSYFPRPAAEA